MVNEQEAVLIAAEICERREGLYLRPYLCPANVPTIGYGTTHYPNGAAVTLRDAEITKVYARHLLISHLTSVLLPAVKALCPGLDTSKRLAAVLSWSYNFSPSKLRSSTMRIRINERNWPEAARELSRWNRANGRVLRGLVLRRAEEAALLS